MHKDDRPFLGGPLGVASGAALPQAGVTPPGDLYLLKQLLPEAVPTWPGATLEEQLPRKSKQCRARLPEVVSAPGAVT